MKIDTLIQIGGVLHFAILIASFMAPSVLDWKSNLAKVKPMIR